MKISLLFPGYGSQYVGMGKELYDEYRIVQEYFEEASHVLNTNFVKLCFASSDTELSKLSNAYSSLLLIGLATYAVLKEHEVLIDVVAGYNNGEVVALCAASCFSFPDGLYLLHKFCSFYQEMIDNGDITTMRIQGTTTAKLKKVCDDVSDENEKVFIAIYHSPTDHIIAGKRECLESIENLLQSEATIDYLGAEIGLHSSLMNLIVESFKKYLEKVDFKDLKIPLISSFDATVITTGDDSKKRFIEYINSPLRWYDVMKALIDYDVIIVAPVADDIYQMIKKEYPDKIVVPIAKKADIEKLKEIIKSGT